VAFAASLIAFFRFDSAGILLAYLCALCTTALWRNHRQGRDARYAEVLPILERSLNSLELATEEAVFAGNHRAANQPLLRSLDQLGEAFTLVSGTACRACIAETYTETDGPGPATEFLVRTLWRSNAEIAQSRGEPQRVAENTDFSDSMTTGNPFFSNDLVAMYWKREYENSRWSKDAVLSGDVDYRSAIVLPITVKPTTAHDPPARVIAFLCIDAKKAGVFSRRRDVALAAVYARAAYPLLRTLLDSK
jgi:hypothetical protein